MKKYKISNISNGYVIKYDNKRVAFEYQGKDSWKDDDELKTVQELHASLRMKVLNHIMEQIIQERRASLDRNIKVQIEWKIEK